MVEIFNKLVDIDEKKFRDLCNHRAKSINKESAVDIACSLFNLASKCEFEKTKSLSKLIKQKDKYLISLIKNNFPYCYLIGNFREKDWYDAKKNLLVKFKSSSSNKLNFSKKLRGKNCLIFSNDLRSHLGGISIIPYIKLIKKNLNFNFFLLTKNFSQIKYLKLNEKGLLSKNLYNSYFDIFINTTGNLLNSNLIDLSGHSETFLNTWGYSGTSADFQSSTVLLDKNFKKFECRKYYTEKINYIPYLQSLIIKKKYTIPNKKKNNYTIGIFSSSYKIKKKILIEIFKMIKKENIKLFFGFQNHNAKKNILNLAKIFEIKDNIIFSKNSKFDNYINYLNNIDILIDIPYLGGSRSAVDAISMGIPVVTIKCEKSEEKNANCILLDLNLNELIAENIKELPKTIMKSFENYNIIRDKITFYLAEENVKKRESSFINEFSKLV